MERRVHALEKLMVDSAAVIITQQPYGNEMSETRMDSDDDSGSEFDGIIV